MKDAIVRLDRGILRVLTTITQRWIAARNYKKHKVDFLIEIQWFGFALLLLAGIVLPVVLHILEREIFTATTHLFFWGITAYLEWMSIQVTILELKPFHDYMFSMRETPAVHAMQKEMLEELFERNRRERLKATGIFVALVVGIMWLLMFLNAFVPDPVTAPVCVYFATAILVNTVRRYMLYVFDFDEPKKKKKASEAISEWLRRVWTETVAGFAPRPALGI